MNRNMFSLIPYLLNKFFSTATQKHFFVTYWKQNGTQEYYCTVQRV
jgi:hypothetical protein